MRKSSIVVVSLSSKNASEIYLVDFWKKLAINLTNKELLPIIWSSSFLYQ